MTSGAEFVLAFKPFLHPFSQEWAVEEDTVVWMVWATWGAMLAET